MAKKAETVTESQNIFLGSEVVKYGKRTYTFEFYADAERDPEKEAAFADAFIEIAVHALSK